jgi:hypothetical protein
LLIPRKEGDAELCPNEKKMVDESRLFNVHGCGGMDQLFQSHPVSWAHTDHAHRDPRRVNPTDYRQPDVNKGLLAFQPLLDFHKIPYSQVIRGDELMPIL